MTDVKDEEISLINFDGGLTVLKGGLYKRRMGNHERNN